MARFFGKVGYEIMKEVEDGVTLNESQGLGKLARMALTTTLILVTIFPS